MPSSSHPVAACNVLVTPIAMTLMGPGPDATIKENDVGAGSKLDFMPEQN
jgi:hypothetical protein